MSDLSREQQADLERRAAGERAAAMVEDGMVIGFGTGRAAAHALAALANRVHSGLRVSGVPTSQKTTDLCTKLGLPLVTLEEHPVLDLVIDGADEVDPDRQVLKGGGGALTREKLVALASKKRVLVMEKAKLVNRLGTTRGLPIELVNFGWTSTLKRIEELMPGAARRPGPLSDNGGVLIDAPLPPNADLRALARSLDSITGVIEHGLFLDLDPMILVGAA
jgi:ribose 5-phosphate isomerase A